MIIREAIADALNELRNTSWYGCVVGRDIRSAEFRHGLGEIRVEFVTDSDRNNEVETIPAEPVLNALLEWALSTEGAE